MIEPLVIGSLHIPWHGVADLLGVWIGIWLGLSRMLRSGLPAGKVVAVQAGAILAGWLGARGLGWLVAAGSRALGADRGTTWQPSLTLVGGLLGGVCAVLLLCRWLRLPAGQVLDRGAAVPVPIGAAVGRLGCLADGCCNGLPTTSWLAVRMPDVAGTWCPRYPAPIMSALADVLIFAAVLGVERRWRDSAREWRPFPGFLTLLFFALYALERLLVGIVREEPRWWGPLSWAQMAALLALVVVAVLLVAGVRRSGRGRGASATARR